MKRVAWWIVLAMAAMMFSGCRFAVVESGEVRIEAATPTPEATPRPDATADPGA